MGGALRSRASGAPKGPQRRRFQVGSAVYARWGPTTMAAVRCTCGTRGGGVTPRCPPTGLSCGWPVFRRLQHSGVDK
jgi:hypothetical protein